MKPIALLSLCVFLISPAACGQGYFLFSNSYPESRTRLGSINGPLAGRGIWAQPLAGLTIDSLAPVGMPAEHYTNGLVYGGVVAVPGNSFDAWGYVQLLAWDGRLWGTNLTGVPADQFGRTDIVRILFVADDHAIVPLPFTQPAIVPIPEPSVLALGMLGLGLLLGLRSRWRWQAAARAKMNAAFQSAVMTTSDTS